MNRPRQTLALLAAALTLNGCATVVTGDGARLHPRDPAFADYVEYVFRLQNDAATDIAFGLDAETFDSPRYRQLETAETALLDACEGLNAIAVARQQGERLGNLTALRAARNAPQCEHAALAAVGLLDNPAG